MLGMMVQKYSIWYNLSMGNATQRERKKFKFDPDTLRACRDTPNPKQTQEVMADTLGISLTTLKKAERGDCIDAAVARKILARLKLLLKKDKTDLGLSPCTEASNSDIAVYLKDLHTKTGTIEVRGLIVGGSKAPNLPIEKVYVPLNTTATDPRPNKRTATLLPDSSESGKPETQTLEQRIELTRRLVVVGTPGSGKSTFLKHVAHQHSRPDTTQFPVLIRISSLEDFIWRRIHGPVSGLPDDDSADWLPLYLESLSQESTWGLTADFFRARLRDPNTVILLDGLDEIPNPTRRYAVARLFERSVQAFAAARFVVSTRPTAYVGQSTLAGFETVTIGDFDEAAVTNFLSHWSGFLFQDDKEGARRHNQDLLDARRYSVDIREMTRNPLMLTALAVIQWNQHRIPEQRAELYESILKWLSEAHNDKNRRLGHECLAIFGVLALKMHCWPGGRIAEIEKDDAARIIAPKFRAEPDHQRRETAALEFLEEELLDSGIMVSSGSVLRFWHLTFQEYLAARASTAGDAAALLFAHDRWMLPEWREVILLVTGVLIRNGADERVDAIFQSAMARADQGSLAVKARAAGLLGAALRDLRPWKNYRAPDEAGYRDLLNEILAIFHPLKAARIDIQIRREAAEALGQAGDPRLAEDNWISLPGGTFFIGAQKTRRNELNYDPDAEGDEPVRQVILGPFAIGRFPVTVQEFRLFVDDDENGYLGKTYWAAGSGKLDAQLPFQWDEQALHPNRPVTGISWYAASAYCAWISARLGSVIRLPSEQEWEFAARGLKCRRYPWGGEQPDPNRANYAATNVNQPTPVGLFPAGNTPEGIADLAGNVWEWTTSDYSKQSKVVRGASYIYDARRLRAASRYRLGPGCRSVDVGFRCVRE